MRFSIRAICAAWLLIIFSGNPARAQATIPSVISFSGFLSDNTGTPVTDTVSIQFRLYDDPSTTTYLWTETQEVGIIDGVFNVYLGEATPIPDSAFEPMEVYLGMKVGADDEMTPRERLASTAWSYRSGCLVSVWYADTDGDGYGDKSSTTTSCTQPTGFVNNALDCNDGVSGINPGATEICNNVDDDCNDAVDDGTATASCGDSNTCTMDSCNGGSCSHTFAAEGISCDDGDACTTGEQCDGAGLCLGVPVNCDDSEECTIDFCAGGCQHSPVANGTACTGGTCVDGVCTP
jgi:Putative metal-binding motif